MRLVVLFLIFAPLLAIAQSGRLKYADKMFDQKRYYYAAEGYEDVLERGVDPKTIASKLAASYYEANNKEKALEWHRFLFNEGIITADEHLRLIYLLKYDDQLEKAKSMADLYIQKFGNNKVIDQFVFNYDKLLDLKNNPKIEDFELVEIDSMYRACESSGNQISASHWTGDSLFVITNEKINYYVRREYAADKSNYYHMFVSTRDSSGKLANLELINLDTTASFNISHICFDQNSDKIYFSANKLGKRMLNVIPQNEKDLASSDSSKFKNLTSNAKLVVDYFPELSNVSMKRLYGNEDDVIPMRIYSADFIDGKVGNITELSIGENSSYNCAYPSISEDGKFIYFSADLPGGIGGMDIYRAELLSDGNLKDVTNLGDKINSKGNELYPFIKSSSNVLYFSSNGLPTVGGYDIFVGFVDGDGVGIKSINLGLPINSNEDEFSFVNNESEDRGYVSTNYFDTSNVGNESLVAFKQYKKFQFSGALSGKIVDVVSNRELKDVLIHITDEDGEILDSIRTDENGFYKLGIYQSVDKVKLKVISDDYYETEKEIDIIPTEVKYDENDFVLMPIIDYFVEGLVYGSDPETPDEIYPLPNTEINVISMTKDTLMSFVSDSTGWFKSNVLPNLRYGMEVDYFVAFSKKGFTNEKYYFNAPLAEETSIVISDTLSPVKLYKIGFGTDIESIVVLNDIYFDFDESYIRPDAAIELDKVVNFMVNNPEVKIEVRSHTDSRGGAYYNLLLSDRRARSTREYLIVNGIPSYRVKFKPFGETELKIPQSEIDNATPEEQDEMHELNRRTEFIIVD